MNIDERLDRLTERHEALTESEEMLARDLRDMKSLVTGISEGTARLLHVAEIHEVRDRGYGSRDTG